MTINEKAEKAKNFHKLFQGLVIILANHRAGVKITKDFRPSPIFKWEGGGIINGEEIVFTRNGNTIECYDDYHSKNRKEPGISEATIEYLLNTIDWNEETIEEQVHSIIGVEIGLDKNDLNDILYKFVSNPFGDPMRSFFLDY